MIYLPVKYMPMAAVCEVLVCGLRESAVDKLPRGNLADKVLRSRQDDPACWHTYSIVISESPRF
jgi:hypothetical protein